MKIKRSPQHIGLNSHLGMNSKRLPGNSEAESNDKYDPIMKK